MSFIDLRLLAIVLYVLIDLRILTTFGIFKLLLVVEIKSIEVYRDHLLY